MTKSPLLGHKHTHYLQNFTLTFFVVLIRMVMIALNIIFTLLAEF